MTIVDRQNLTKSVGFWGFYQISKSKIYSVFRVFHGFFVKNPIMSPSAWSRVFITDLFLKAIFWAIPDLDLRVKSPKNLKPEVSNTYWLLHRKNHSKLECNFWALFSTFLTCKFRSFLQCFFVKIKKYRFFTLFYLRNDAIDRAFLKKALFSPIFENDSLRRLCQNETTPIRIFLHFWRSYVFRHWCIAI